MAIFKQSDRPKLNQQPDSYEYQITGQVYWSLKSRVQRLQEKARENRSVIDGNYLLFNGLRGDGA
ncbi:hypothetical protein CJF42_12760 [Pseudoalteromonas sp. NBT06-2]|uniref:hypothetical protein n=1 Tax=Pseudoalteromonas sp. NBT06-2 TaxID=2025950 RepID=UPI000BA64BAC|nr:hypothetical protein [Pseudoalteromonas sp. NBT06-2]PAJ74016.1 hypothetical protein CJF42_12760 [Pseudoalteromonas sp. NBT06-2]